MSRIIYSLLFIYVYLVNFLNSYIKETVLWNIVESKNTDFAEMYAKFLFEKNRFVI